MPEVWLRPNHRALAVMMALPAVLLGVTAAALVVSLVTRQNAWVSIGLAVAVLLFLWMLVPLIHMSRLPRLAYADGELLVYLPPHMPARVPIDVVEVFFLGQGDAPLPKLAGRDTETQNIVVRLAESAAEWKQRPVGGAYGLWCENYITIRGSWCEPITPELMQQINDRLIAVQRLRREALKQTGAAT
jgi:hypothetical protein